MVMSLIYVTNAILEINSEKRKTGILRKNSMWERAGVLKGNETYKIKESGEDILVKTDKAVKNVVCPRNGID